MTREEKDSTYIAFQMVFFFSNKTLVAHIHFYRTLDLASADDWSINILATDYLIYSIEWSCVPNGVKGDCTTV